MKNNKTGKKVFIVLGVLAKGLISAAAVVTFVCFYTACGSAENAAKTLKQYAIMTVEAFSGKRVVKLGSGRDISLTDIKKEEAQPIKKEEIVKVSAADIVPESESDSEGDMRKIKEKQLITAKNKYGDIYVKNGNSHHGINIKEVLSQKPKCTIKKNDEYQVLIIHTHTTESYMSEESSVYKKGTSWRNADKSKSVVAVGDVIADILNDAGIKTLHLTDYHDYPKYTGAYNRAKETISNALKKHPSIQMVLDVHRDSITASDGTKTKPTAVIDGKKAAQVMIISGCNDTGKLDFPHWEYNLRMAVQLQKQLVSDWKGLARPLYFAPFRYNMDKTYNSLLLEFGTEANTLEEAKYSASMTAQSLVKVLSRYIKK